MASNVADRSGEMLSLLAPARRILPSMRRCLPLHREIASRNLQSVHERAQTSRLQNAENLLSRYGKTLRQRDRSRRRCQHRRFVLLASRKRKRSSTMLRANPERTGYRYEIVEAVRHVLSEKDIRRSRPATRGVAMPYIKTIPPSEATGKLKEIYRLAAVRRRRVARWRWCAKCKA